MWLGGRTFGSPDNDSYGVLINSTDNEVVARAFETVWCWCWVLWKQGAGAGCWCPVLVRAVVLVLGPVSWLWAVRVVEIGAGAVQGCRVLGAGWCWVLGVPVLGACAGRRELVCRCLVLVPASDSEVITTAASDSEG